MEINYAENQRNCYPDFIVSTHESTSSYNKWSIIFWWSKVSCISDGDSLCRRGISASECIVQPFYADAWFVEERQDGEACGLCNMDHLWIINGSYGGCADKIVGTGEIFRKEKMTNEGIDYRKWNCRDVCCNRSSRT